MSGTASESEYLNQEILARLLGHFGINQNKDSINLLKDFFQNTQLHKLVRKKRAKNTFENKFSELSYNFCLACL